MIVGRTREEDAFLPIGKPDAVIVNELIVRRMFVGDLKVTERQVIPPAANPHGNDDAVEVVH
jgi:hypothetical protein